MDDVAREALEAHEKLDASGCRAYGEIFEQSEKVDVDGKGATDGAAQQNGLPRAIACHLLDANQV